MGRSSATCSCLGEDIYIYIYIYVFIYSFIFIFIYLFINTYICVGSILTLVFFSFRESTISETGSALTLTLDPLTPFPRVPYKVGTISETVPPSLVFLLGRVQHQERPDRLRLALTWASTTASPGAGDPEAAESETESSKAG